MADKAFRVAAISHNMNSFGLRQFIFVAQDGTAWQACGNLGRVAAYPQGSEHAIRLDENGEPDFTQHLFEIPEPFPETDLAPKGRAPQGIVDEIWPPLAAKLEAENAKPDAELAS